MSHFVVAKCFYMSRHDERRETTTIDYFQYSKWEITENYMIKIVKARYFNQQHWYSFRQIRT
jgi:hypothetical protein